jgi:hypothetical protein
MPHFADPIASLLYLALTATALLAAWPAISRLLAGQVGLSDLALLVHTALNVAPLAGDLLWGQATIQYFPGIHRALMDATTSLVYAVWVCGVSLTLGVAAGAGFNPKVNLSPPKEHEVELKNLNAPLRRARTGLGLGLLGAAIAIPVTVLAFAPEPHIYRTYGVGAAGALVERIASYHAIVIAASRVAVVAAVVGTLLVRRLGFVRWILGLMAATPALWMYGKRSIALLFLVAMLGIWLTTGRESKKSERLAGIIVAAVVFGIFSSAYQQIVRPDLDTIRFTTYERQRIDFSRDPVLRLSVFRAITEDEPKILPAFGQSVVFYATLPVPRSAWPQKPLPYAQYVTSAALDQPPRMWGWGLTTSILGEVLDNFSKAGFVIAPLAILLLIALIDRIQSAVARAIGAVCLCLLFAQHILSFWPLVITMLLIEFTVRLRSHGTPHSARIGAHQSRGAGPGQGTK